MKSVDSMTDEEVKNHARNVVRLAGEYSTLRNTVSVHPALLTRLLDMIPPSWESLESMRQGIG
ncbi:MAG: hypothetical protein KGL39_38130 [Patescibacteria group bacterium]|nr:hypothetical protein [Patescibacteria group bacterium]